MIGLWSLLACIGVLLTGPLHIWAVMWCILGAVAWCILFWANTWITSVKGYNWVCLICSALFLSAEGCLRGSKAGLQWSSKGATTEVNDIFGWISTANEEPLEKGEHTQYPDKGYPVSISPKERIENDLLLLVAPLPVEHFKMTISSSFTQQSLNKIWVDNGRS